MHINRTKDGSIEISFSYTLMSYIAMFGALGCAMGVGYLFIAENEPLFSIRVLGLVIAGVVLGIASIILFEKSHFMFNRQTGLLLWEKKKYLRITKGELPFYEIKDIKLYNDDFNKNGFIIEIFSKQKRLRLIDSYLINTDQDLEKLVNDLKELIGLGIDVSPKSRARALLDLGQEKNAIELIRNELHMSIADARKYLGID